MELYEKIMGELAEVSYNGTILYSAFGEPLLYKNIEAIMVVSKQYCPQARIETVTDGDFVTPEKLRSLFQAGLDTLLVSMYDGPHQEEHFKGIIAESGVDEDRVILRTRWLPPEEDYGITLSNRAGMIELPLVGVGKPAEPLKRPCYYPFYQTLVDYDGSVLLCPHDWGKKLIAGNLNHQTIHEIWGGPLMRRARRNLANSDRNFAPCDVCDVDGTLIGKDHFQEWLKYYEASKPA
jgi:radical SAM protein with 4Fe4S-binding SPASM domain